MRRNPGCGERKRVPAFPTHYNTIRLICQSRTRADNEAFIIGEAHIGCLPFLSNALFALTTTGEDAILAA
jgi:hypothetical protein